MRRNCTKQKIQILSGIFFIYSRFEADDDGYSYGQGKGFHIQYERIKLFTKCGGSRSLSSSSWGGVLTSPSYPNPYPELASCGYSVTVRSGMYLTISFINMDIDCQGTPSDYIEVLDNYAIMGRFCGNGSNVPQLMQTTQNYLRIR